MRDDLIVSVPLNAVIAVELIARVSGERDILVMLSGPMVEMRMRTENYCGTSGWPFDSERSLSSY